ncbi:MAG: hypothetical protein J5797_00850 [Prevotella sp.]|nr:hypothetical protein [Prevotella sp.]
MKKIYLALMCMAGFTLMTACGGKSDKKDGEAANEENTEQNAEQKDEAGATADSDSPTAKFEAALKECYGLTFDQVKPDFAISETNKQGASMFYGDTRDADAKANLLKADGTNPTQEEFNAYATKMYNLTKSISQDGKNIVGFNEASTSAEALAEKPIDKCIGKNEYDVDIIMTGWAFRMNDTFYQCDVSQGIARNGNPEPIELRLYKGLQKSLSESMEDADKAMEQLGY